MPSLSAHAKRLTSSALEEEYLHGSADALGTRLPSPTLRHHSSSSSPLVTKKAPSPLANACNFEAFSLHFHLPLKAAAEKFGVRATAFKKRCRAIGIRHWPYRKVRSLKRSLQELNRCKEQGTLNEKQQYQYATFKKQLDKLMSPETYGIDPSGRITHHHFVDDDDDSGDDEASYATHSPRYGATFAECSISPAEGEKTFGDFSQPLHLRSLRKQHATYLPPHLTKSLPSSSYMPELPGLRFGSKDSLNAMNPFYSKYSFSSSAYDHYLHDPLGLDMKNGSSSKHHMFPEDSTHLDDSYSDRLGGHLSESSNEPQSDIFSSSELKSDESSRLVADHGQDDLHDPSATVDYSSERFFDDVFLQISPDYGCLV